MLVDLVAQTLAVGKETEGVVLQPATVEQAIRRGMAEGHGRWYVVEDDAAMGSCMVTREWSDWRCGGYRWIQSVYVLPAARRQGVWRTLWAAVQEVAAEQGALSVRLLVHQENITAIAVYEDSGFSPMAYRAFEA